jgi:hypothetical protein
MFEAHHLEFDREAISGIDLGKLTVSAGAMGAFGR